MIERRRALQGLSLALFLAGCATMGQDPVQVLVVGVEPLQGEGMELRFLVKLRVQNPNDQPIEFNGIYLELDVRGSTLASGVSDVAGVVPRYGETVLTVPVTASALRIARQAISLYASSDRSRIDYALRGKIDGPSFSAVRFESKGELTLPGGTGSVPLPAP